jgi:hypothetical protein
MEAVVIMGLDIAESDFQSVRREGPPQCAMAICMVPVRHPVFDKTFALAGRRGKQND